MRRIPNRLPTEMVTRSESRQQPQSPRPLMMIRSSRSFSPQPTRVEAQKAYYEEGRITIDRFIDGLARLEKVELLAAKTDAERAEIRKRHVNILDDIAKREDGELQIGKGTIADVSEARQRHLEAEYEMKVMEKEAAEKAAILKRLSDLERVVDSSSEKDRRKSPPAIAD